MARRRDYKAEEARRNARARARGFSSRGQQRKAIERGKIPPLAPGRIRKPETVKAQQERERRERREKSYWFKAGFRSERAYRKAKSDAADWSALHAGTHIAQYDPDNALEGIGVAEYTKAYMDAFVEGPGRYKAVRRSGGSPELYRYFVTVTGHYAPDEYESRYGRQG